MNVIVVFDSLHGNTERVADAIATGLAPLGEVRLARAGDLASGSTADAWVIGGPTHYHGMSPALRSAVAAWPRGSLQGIPVATFDTRYRYPRIMSGSAAHSAAGHLKSTGCRLVAEESFFVQEGPKPASGGKPDPADEHLEPGELERAREWGSELVVRLHR